MIEKGIRDGICHVIHGYAKANNKYLKNYNQKIGLSYIIYLDVSNPYGWAISQKLPVNGSEWVEKLSEVDERFIKDYDENSNKGYIVEEEAEHPKCI